MTNLDMKKTLKHLYAPSAKDVSVVDIPPMHYLMIDGEGNPNSAPRYAQAVEALYGLAYTIRAIRKNAGETFTVMPLEGLWALKGKHNPEINLTEADKDSFVWTLMVLQPESITPEIVEQARAIVNKKKDSPELVNEVRFEQYHEGEAVQIMHIGSYNDEGPNVARLHAHITDNGWKFGDNLHHEIYLNDPRKVAAEKLKTVIRQPFTRS
ncbi:MAG: GyrI-like domain-containing protein [Aggregatilineales bacterium]